MLIDHSTHTFLWWTAGSGCGGAPSWRLHGNIWQDSAREEREVGVREEEDTSLSYVWRGGDPWLI